MKPKVVLFDLFETLITEFESGMRKSKRNYNYEALLGIDYDTFKAEWNARTERRMNGSFKHYRDVIRDMLDAQSLPYPHDHVEQLYRERVAEKLLPFDRPDEAVLSMLQRLRAQGVKLGLVSNCTEEEVQGWPNSPFARMFDAIVFSYEAGMSKPDPDIYKLALDRLGVRALEAVFVGDGGSGELDGAARAGIQPFHARWFNTYIESNYPKLTRPAELLDAIAGGIGVDQDGDAADVHE